MIAIFFFNTVFYLFFFFQAEDGIRDLIVTGVQTVLFRSLRLTLADTYLPIDTAFPSSATRLEA